MEINEIGQDYENRMLAFEMDCNDGKGVPKSCHNVGEYFANVKEDFERARKVYDKNCRDNKYGSSCFNLGRMYRKYIFNRFNN